MYRDSTRNCPLEYFQKVLLKYSIHNTHAHAHMTNSTTLIIWSDRIGPFLEHTMRHRSNTINHNVYISNWMVNWWTDIDNKLNRQPNDNQTMNWTRTRTPIIHTIIICLVGWFVLSSSSFPSSFSSISIWFPQQHHTRNARNKQQQQPKNRRASVICIRF